MRKSIKPATVVMFQLARNCYLNDLSLARSAKDVTLLRDRYFEIFTKIVRGDQAANDRITETNC